jgi:hypothetical protein
MATITETEPQAQAIIADATRRLAELEAVRDVLLPDAGDPVVAAELEDIESELRAAVAVLDNEQTTILAGREQESDQ